MQSAYAAGAVDVAFDDPNLIADAGLVPVIALAERIGLPELVADQVSIVDAENSAGANPAAKVMSLVAGMVAGGDSIDDMALLRHGAMGKVFDRPYAPSTLGSFSARLHVRSRPPARRGRLPVPDRPGRVHAGGHRHRAAGAGRYR